MTMVSNLVFFDVLVGIERHRGCLTSLLPKLPSDTEANGKIFFKLLPKGVKRMTFC